MFFRWLNAVRKEFKTLVTGSLLLFGMGLAQGVWKVPISRWLYVAVIGCFLTWAFYRTWSKEHTSVETVTKTKDAEIAAQNTRITELSRKPYPEALKRKAEQVLDNLTTLEGRHVLAHLMVAQQVEVGRVFPFPEIPQAKQIEQLAIAKQHEIVQHKEDPPRSRITYWVINPQFRPVLEDVLYRDGRLQ